MIGEIEAKTRVAQRLIGLFFWERMVYLVLMGVAFCALVASIIAVLVFDPGVRAVVTVLLGGAGVLLFAYGRLLGMQEQVSALISDEGIGGESRE